MPIYSISTTDSATDKELTTPEISSHVLAVSANGTMLTGTLTVEARAPGSKEFESIPDGIIDLTSLSTVIFTFAVAEYRFKLSGFTGSATEIIVTDTVSRGFYV